ncbi:response regulator transcription factor [Thiohalophilus sp.]|uniref:response regulator transcription factor n=1 Tax=Thiohalophilus sp. TaxID=3028392 RepID=UPI002ACEB17C|nr:response regulator [Thiohalophilus sp.]MDZ7804652.1 response regulator [Thiohalophilus sp.]
MSGQILIAEDEPYIVDALSFILRQAGHTVTAESDGSAVLEALRKTRPDLLILDIMLPTRNGFELLKELKADEEFRQLPVLVLTAKGQAKDRAMAEQLGTDAFIAKPFSNAEVLQCVERLIGQSQSAAYDH